MEPPERGLNYFEIQYCIVVENSLLRRTKYFEAS
jgi:hypothetical protein